MKIIFLDMDGPVVSHRACVAFGEIGLLQQFDPISLGFLKQLIKAGRSSENSHISKVSDVKVVFTSTWITSHDRREFQWMFGAAGCKDVTINIHEDWCIDDTHNRAESTQRWLDAHPEVTHWCVIDDESCASPDKSKLVHVDGLNGMSLQNFDKAVHLLHESRELFV